MFRIRAIPSARTSILLATSCVCPLKLSLFFETSLVPYRRFEVLAVRGPSEVLDHPDAKCDRFTYALYII